MRRAGAALLGCIAGVLALAPPAAASSSTYKNSLAPRNTVYINSSFTNINGGGAQIDYNAGLGSGTWIRTIQCGDSQCRVQSTIAEASGGVVTTISHNLVSYARSQCKWTNAYVSPQIQLTCWYTK